MLFHLCSLAMGITKYISLNQDASASVRKGTIFPAGHFEGLYPRFFLQQFNTIKIDTLIFLHAETPSIKHIFYLLKPLYVLAIN